MNEHRIYDDPLPAAGEFRRRITLPEAMDFARHVTAPDGLGYSECLTPRPGPADQWLSARCSCGAYVLDWPTPTITERRPMTPDERVDALLHEADPVTYSVSRRTLVTLIREAVHDERERCAKVAESMDYSIRTAGSVAQFNIEMATRIRGGA